MKGRDPLKDVLCSLEYGVLYLGWKRALFWAGAFGMIFGFTRTVEARKGNKEEKRE